MTTKYLRSFKKTLLLFPLLLAGCEFFGLEFQQPYKYDYEIGMYDNRVHLSTLDFIKSRPDLFRLLIEGIEYAEMESFYSEKEATYLLPTNAAFESTTLNYFQMHPLLFIEEGDSVYITPKSLIFYPKEQVKELLLYHMVKGRYTWSNLPANPTWYETFASADTAKINMYLTKDLNPNIVFNNFDGHYKTNIKPRTSNLLSNEGAYIHVIESWLDRPTAGIIKK